MSNPLARDLDHVLARTGAVWADLRGARIFVTGGTGFFGCWLLESFAAASSRLQLGASMVVLTRSPEAFRAKAPHLAFHPNIELLQGDVRDFRFPQGPFTHVIHGATDVGATLHREQPLEILDTIVEGTRRVLDFSLSAGARRFLLISSGAVYGRQPAEITHVPENYQGGPDPLDAHSIYGEGKRTAELLATLYSNRHGLECPIARPFAFAGPYMPLDAHFAVGNFIADCLHERPIQIAGDGTPFRSYLYAADLAIWLWTILVRGQSQRAYNVGSEQEISIADLALAVRQALGARLPVRTADTPRPGVPAERYVPGTARARLELGLEQWIPLEDTICRTAQWHAAEVPA